MDFSARAARPTARQARGRGVGWLAVIELTTILRRAYGWSATVRREARRRAEVAPLPPPPLARLSRSDVDTIQVRAKAPPPASDGRLISPGPSSAAAKTWLSRGDGPVDALTGLPRAVHRAQHGGYPVRRGGRHGGGLAGGRSTVRRAVPAAGAAGGWRYGPGVLGPVGRGAAGGGQGYPPGAGGGAGVPGPVRAGSGCRPDGERVVHRAGGGRGRAGTNAVAGNGVRGRAVAG